MRLRGQNSELKHDRDGEIDQNDDKWKDCARAFWYPLVLYLFFSDWEVNEDFFTKFKKHLIDCGCAEHLSTFETMESYIRGKGKEDSAKHSGKSILRKCDHNNRNRGLPMDVGDGFRNVVH